MNFDNRSGVLQLKPKARNKILPFVTKYNPAAPNVKKITVKELVFNPKPTRT